MVEYRPSCADYLRLHFGFSYFEKGPRWNSVTLRESDVGMDSYRARWIAEQIRAQTDGYLWAEAKRELLPLIEADDSWLADFERAKEYFNYGYTFQRWAEWADARLPDGGNILHIGGGTGMMAGYLAVRAPKRRLVISGNHWAEFVGLPRLRAIMRDRYGSEDNVPIFLNRNFGSFPVKKSFYRGMLTTHSYFALGAGLQSTFFQKAAEGLVPGGKLVMIEPVVESEMRRSIWYTRQVGEGAEAGAPQDEFELAFYTFIYYGALTRLSGGGGKRPELPVARMNEIRERSRAAGLHLVEETECHDGVSMRLVFQKPLKKQ